MRVMSGISTEFPGNMFSDISRYRHNVFVEMLGWDLHTQDGIELDQFDRQDTVYVVAQNDDGDISGCARLLPTTRPYLLGELFPQLLNGLTPPSSPDIWELSRFAAMDLNEQNPNGSGQFSSPIAVRLLQESIECAASHGAKQIITVSPVGVERLLRRAGFRAHRAGPPMVIDGYPLFACIIEVEGAACLKAPNVPDYTGIIKRHT